MNTSESFDLLSDVLLDDERIISIDEREFLADLLRQSKNNSNPTNTEITRTIARIAGELVVQRAGGLVAEGILQRLQSATNHQQHRSKIKDLGPRPPNPVPPNPGPTPGISHKHASRRYGPGNGPRPPQPVPPSPGPGPGMQITSGAKGILNPNMTVEFPAPKCVVLEEFLAPAELSDLLAYTLSNQEQFIVSEVISPGVPSGSVADFEYRRSHVLMNLGLHQERFLNRLCSTLPRLLPKLGMEPFPISRMEAQITVSKDGDFFRWHSDNGEGEVAARQVTFVYFFHREPKGFEGGELRIQDSCAHDQPGNYYAIVPKQNQVVLFDSSLTHEISPVKCPSSVFADSRFTVNGWISR
jgi:SM-20-related protein